jgi:hypothetical protein
MSSAINKTIQDTVISEMSKQVENLKVYLSDKLEDSSEICSLIDDFKNQCPKDTVEIKPSKSTKSSNEKVLKEKKTRTKSYYSHWLSERLSSYAEENKGDNDRKTRMAFISKEWAAYKKTTDFEKHKEEWDLKASSGSDSDSVVFKEPKEPKKQTKKQTKKQVKEPKEPKKQDKKQVKKQKSKKNSQMTDTNVSDSDEDEILVKSSSKTIQNSNDSDSDGDDKFTVQPIVSDDESDDDI